MKQKLKQNIFKQYIYLIKRNLIKTQVFVFLNHIFEMFIVKIMNSIKLNHNIKCPRSPTNIAF